MDPFLLVHKYSDQCDKYPGEHSELQRPSTTRFHLNRTVQSHTEKNSRSTIKESILTN